MKKRWTMLLLAVALATTAAISTAVVMAGESDGTSSAVNKFASKVAVILGLDETSVDAAIKQAKAELKEEAAQTKLAAYQAKLDEMVQDGKLTQEEADEKAKAFRSALESHFAWNKKAAIDYGAIKAKLAAFEEKLTSLVEQGGLTQEQADKKLKWLQDKLTKA